ncbi:MAG: FAD-binding oxidoreductase, partial [Streptosporangiaceae bacterium]
FGPKIRPRWRRCWPCARTPACPSSRRGNTGLVGGDVPLHGEVVLSLTRLNQLGPVDQETSQVTAGAGVTLQQVADAGPGLDLPILIASRDGATVGGAVATNAGGVRVLRYGPMRAQLRGIEAVLADGTVVSHLAGLVTLGGALAPTYRGQWPRHLVTRSASPPQPPGVSGRLVLGRSAGWSPDLRPIRLEGNPPSLRDHASDSGGQVRRARGAEARRGC